MLGGIYGRRRERGWRVNPIGREMAAGGTSHPQNMRAFGAEGMLLGGGGHETLRARLRMTSAWASTASAKSEHPGSTSAMREI